MGERDVWTRWVGERDVEGARCVVVWTVQCQHAA